MHVDVYIITVTDRLERRDPRIRNVVCSKNAKRRNIYFYYVFS